MAASSGALLSVSDIDQFYGGSHILRKLGFEARVGEVTVVKISENSVVLRYHGKTYRRNVQN